jgi:formylglycine-generating enzyme required for sulfatase activity/tRNA A-37 threonylcarbamoyl transferase component Bud32
MPQNCPNCNTQNKDTAKFCNGCGRKMDSPGSNPVSLPAMPIYCTRCGEQNQGSAQSCQACGEELEYSAKGTSFIAPVSIAKLNTPDILVNRYEIISTIGSGAMGCVYKAKDTRLGNIVAVKQMLSSFTNPQEIQHAETRFKEEAKMLSALRHQGLPKVIDYSDKEPSTGKPLHFLVMEFIEGKDLRTIIHERGQKPFPVDEVLDYFRQILDILHYLHTHIPPIVHRDLNPRNIMVQNGKIFLVDFGIAKLFNPQQKGTAIGTAGYAAPEQYKGAAEPRSDIFSLGAVMHYLVTGIDPEDASSKLFSFEQVRKANPSVPEYLDTLIVSMVDIVIDQRPQSAEALIKTLDEKQQISAQSVQHPQAPFFSNLNTATTLVKETPSVVAAIDATSPAPPKATPPSPSPSHSIKKVIAKECAEIVLIPAGEFLMGSIAGQGEDDEHPQHNVYLDAYYISKYQVTNEQFTQFMRETGYGAEGDWKKYAGTGKEKHPVVCVTWNDARAYCRWAGGVLPTEAQWEKAARGADGREYPWGKSWDESQCNWYKGPKVAGMADIIQGRGTTPVGSFPSSASPYGIYDMVGNILEWCADWYDENYYKSSPSRNPEGIRGGQYRVLRGGSWLHGGSDGLRCAYRHWTTPDTSRRNSGFRVCYSFNDGKQRKGSQGVLHTQAPTSGAPKAPQPSPSQSHSVDKVVNTKDSAEMVLIPAGEFLMGTNKQGLENEHPRHNVYLDEYYIYKYEVTNEQFAQFVRETGYRAKGDWKNYAAFGKEKHPVVCVNWNDAMAYCRWAGGNLPTEAQWEKAARGTDGREYPWGDNWDESKCNWRGSKVVGMADTIPVGSFPTGASPYGIHDMAGNVWEWCSDWYDKDYYKNSPSINPEGPVSGVNRVTRGGSWNNYLTDYFRCANRDWFAPDHFLYYSGFRVCRLSNTP